ncbi:serine/threonine-protein kinase [Marinospirillum alkaliphilum]|uniref:non-specific serine/threonine protein kinase n=1 Tax=Marinospirillum alkaliphilum DSM 21637 TaxID=1122209 RepID=A0A1K1TDV6_9GAMM|nr:serine/threonine-protein kinase [Marinospirillum alkaliphilum]SFW98596.1 Serine/threonine protein kinase [Marinospirillum alkaliphilum DSM 21637]
MHLGELRVSYGQAYLAQDRRSARSSMAVSCPKDSQLAIKGVAGIIADSTWRNAIAKQAGETCVKGFIADYYATPDNWDVKTSANRVLSALNSWLFAQSRTVTNGSYISSMSVLLLRGRQANLFHMGDTLVYRLRGAELQLLNREHTTYLGGYRYPSRAMGMDPSLDIDYLNFNVRQGDIFLFTTQAVKGTLMPSDFVQLISQYPEDLNQACDAILQQAMEKASKRGYSSYNFCFQLLRVDQIPHESSEGLGEAYSALPVPEELQAGDELDGYRVLEVISRSATSRVYRVHDPKTDRILVLKAPSPQIARKREFIAHFIMQQWVVERVSSPYVARVVDLSRPRRQLYYLMESVDGRTLEEWMQQNPDADIKVRVDLVEQLTKAVRALHRREILHQNLTPANILVDHQGVVKLVDFAACGVAKMNDLPPLLTLARRVGLTPYSAPEYRLGREPGERADQFSVAAIAYQLLTGHQPYEGQLEKLSSKVDFSRMEYLPAFQLNPELPIWMDVPLRKALQPNPELRYRRLSEFIYDLKKPAPTAVAPESNESNPLTFWKGLAGVLLLLLLLSLFY